MSTSARAHLWPLSVAAPRSAPPLELSSSPPPAVLAPAPVEPQPKPVQRRTWLNPRPRQVPVVDRLLKLPLELVYLLLSFLDPPSVLALSCTSHPWAAFLRRPTAHTHERTKRVWAQARANARVPQLESDLGGGEEGEVAHEVLLARLLGGWACQVCGRRAARDEDVDFDARVRLCATCRTSMLATTQELSDAYFHLHPRTLGCVFRTSPHDPNVHHPQFEYRYFVPDALAVSAHLYFLEAEALAQGKKAAEVVDEYVRRRVVLRMQVRRDAYKLKAWWKVRDLECKEAERGRQARRHRSVFAKLDDLGFDDIDYDELFDDHYEHALWAPPAPSETSSEADERERLNDDLDRFFESMDPLSDREWRDWKPRIVAFACARHREWLLLERDYVRRHLAYLHELVKRCVGDEAAPLFPPLDSFLRLPSVRAIWIKGDDYVYEIDVGSVLRAFIADVLEAMRNDRLVLLDRLARTLLAEGDPLPASILLALSSSPSPFIDRTPHLGVGPTYLAIPPSDIDAVLERAVALFRCGICGLLAPVARIVPHVHASQGSRAPPRCIVAPAQVRALVREAVGPTASVGECEARGRVWEVEGPAVEVGEDGESTVRTWRECGLTWGEVMQLGLCNVSTLILGPKLVARTSTGCTSARSPTLPPSVEPTDLGKDDKKVRILGSFDFDGAAAKTCRCA